MGYFTYAKNDAYGTLYNSLTANYSSNRIILESGETISPLYKLNDSEAPRNYHLTLTDGVRKEIVKVTEEETYEGRPSFVVERGSEDTTPKVWSSGTKVKINITANSINEVIEHARYFDTDSSNLRDRIEVLEDSVEELIFSDATNVLSIYDIQTEILDIQDTIGTKYSTKSHSEWIQEFESDITDLENEQSSQDGRIEYIESQVGVSLPNELLQNNRLSALEILTTNQGSDIVDLESDVSSIFSSLNSYLININYLKQDSTNLNDYILDIVSEDNPTSLTSLWNAYTEHVNEGTNPISHTWAQINKSGSSLNDLAGKNYAFLTNRPVDDEWGTNSGVLEQASVNDADYIIIYTEGGEYKKVRREYMLGNHRHNWSDLRTASGVIVGSSLLHLASRRWEHLEKNVDSKIDGSSLFHLVDRNYSYLTNTPDDDDFHNKLDLQTHMNSIDEFCFYDIESHSYKRIRYTDLFDSTGFDGRWTSLDFTGASLCHLNLQRKLEDWEKDPGGGAYPLMAHWDCIIGKPNHINFGGGTLLSKLHWAEDRDWFCIWDVSASDYKYITRGDFFKTSAKIGTLSGDSDNTDYDQDTYLEILSKSGSGSRSILALSNGEEGGTSRRSGVIYTSSDGYLKFGIRGNLSEFTGDTTGIVEAASISNESEPLFRANYGIVLGNNATDTLNPTMRLCEISSTGEIGSIGSGVSGSNTGALMLSSDGEDPDQDFIARRVWNTVYNDLADFQKLSDDEIIKPGSCYYRSKDGQRICNKKCQMAVSGIVSDTFGMSMGRIAEENQVPIAVSGYVLASVDKVYEAGTPLTNDENGNLTKMKWWQRILFPERLIAIFDREEKQDVWKNGRINIEVKGRHWVKVK